MLETLLRVGEWQSRGKSKWDRFLEYPKVDTEDKKGRKITNYTLPIIFDLDNQEVVIEQENLEEYDEEKVEAAIPIKVKGGNNKAIYTAVPAKKLNQIYKTFFGKYGEDTHNGELVEAVEKEDESFLTNDFNQLLLNIFNLKERFLEQVRYTKKSGVQEIGIKKVNENFELGTLEKIVFLTVKIKTTEIGFDEPTLFSKVPEYKEFLETSFFGDEEEKTKKEPTRKLCYASGELNEDVEELSIDTRYGLNKMFVTTTKNFASQFDDKIFNKNYQVSENNQKYLDVASEYLLKKGYVIRIANTEHVIIPQFLSTSEVELEDALDGIQIKSDLLFKMKSLKGLSDSIDDELDYVSESVFWLNFVAFDTDRKGYFKSTETIKDVSNFFFEKIIQKFFVIDKEFRESGFVDWDKVMSSYGEPRYFNFNSLYEIIPFRKDKEKKNKALDLFKTILENRKVKREILFDYFTELILCHYYNRYKSYTNVHDYSQKGNRKRKDYFKWAVRDSVFKYLAFFQFLKKLNLIDMEETQVTEEKKKENHDKEVQNFFTEMNYSQEQKAMFFLGRMLNSIEYIQEGKNKTVIQKVNFNGMDKDNIQRLRTGLIEKAKQYNAMGKVIFTDNKFSEQFDYNRWDLNPKEALFFLLTGYSFGAKAKKQDDGSETTENN